MNFIVVRRDLWAKPQTSGTSDPLLADIQASKAPSSSGTPCPPLMTGTHVSHVGGQVNKVIYLYSAVCVPCCPPRLKRKKKNIFFSYPDGVTTESVVSRPPRPTLTQESVRHRLVQSACNLHHRRQLFCLFSSYHRLILSTCTTSNTHTHKHVTSRR